ncbi:phenylacetaldehyde dehydrogenase [Colwellia chukchiensis]|uniref:Phenylacetaldehyde dehydrogenase n=1 Tax=Colwellia chukchiensis TaxID=641665 RepID=A0A1H7G8W1_9GAMM|nr:aldehyde dehydrogenase family protein [Colwellia chukchiensis]SEK34568.1 phenylacetaldehyde dehydrogenase [Colwellia chukchiensis]
MNKDLQHFITQFPVTEHTKRFLAQKQQMYIGGEFCSAQSGNVYEVIEPCTAGLLAQVPDASIADVDLAVAAAKSSFTDSPWSRMKPNERERLLLRLADVIEQHSQTLAELESLDAGKAISGCKAVDIDGSIDVLRYMAGWSTKIAGSTKNVSVEGDHFAYTLKQPVGVVAAIVPWNWPFTMAIWKMAAPLALGCTIVLKPSPLTPLSMLYFAELCQQAGIPKGVVNIVTGSSVEVGSHLVSHPDVDKVSFTGSTQVGKLVGQAAMQNITPVTLELGGKSPMVVFNDADIDKVVAATQQSIFFNTGQVCSAGSRLYVQKELYPQVVDAVVQRVQAMNIGMSLDPNCDVGPVISKTQLDTVLSYIEKGKQEGAKVVCGGAALDGQGYYLQPTVFADCHNDMEIVQKEIFGPVLVVIPFDSEEQALSLANDNIYGLAASVFTQDISRAQRMIKNLEAGTVWVNTHDLVDSCTPFGGVKQSGFGKDLGVEQLAYFLKTKAVWIEV